MYKRLEAELVLKGMSKRKLAQDLEIAYNTLLSKISGKTKFTLDECVKIKSVLNNTEAIEELFKDSSF